MVWKSHMKLLGIVLRPRENKVFVKGRSCPWSALVWPWTAPGINWLLRERRPCALEVVPVFLEICSQILTDPEKNFWIISIASCGLHPGGHSKFYLGLVTPGNPLAIAASGCTWHRSINHHTPPRLKTFSNCGISVYVPTSELWRKLTSAMIGL